MSSTTYTYRPVQSTAQWAIPTKSSAHASASQPYQYSPVYGQLSQPPASRTESITTGGATYSVPSRAQSVSSDSDSDSSGSIDALDYMNERLARTIDAGPLDRSLAIQAQRRQLTFQSSGELNAKTSELQALQALAQSRLKSAKRNFSDGIKAAKDVQRDLEWTQRRVGALNQRAATKWPAQYAVASKQFPALEVEDY